MSYKGCIYPAAKPESLSEAIALITELRRQINQLTSKLEEGKELISRLSYRKIINNKGMVTAKEIEQWLTDYNKIKEI